MTCCMQQLLQCTVPIWSAPSSHSVVTAPAAEAEVLHQSRRDLRLTLWSPGRRLRLGGELEATVIVSNLGRVTAGSKAVPAANSSSTAQQQHLSCMMMSVICWVSSIGLHFKPPLGAPLPFAMMNPMRDWQPLDLLPRPQ